MVEALRICEMSVRLSSVFIVFLKDFCSKQLDLSEMRIRNQGGKHLGPIYMVQGSRQHTEVVQAVQQP